jgi:hypothetical protein
MPSLSFEGETHEELVRKGGLLTRADRARKDAVYEMNASVAREMLKSLRG